MMPTASCRCRRVGVLAASLAALLAACAPLPPAGPAWRPSPNFDARRPNFVILHQTTNRSADAALATLTDPQRKVSAHYLIGRDGVLFQLVDEGARAWHAGESYWGGTTDLNSASIGIELDNDGDEPFPEAQIATLLGLLEDLRTRYRIPPANVLAHGDIAPTRKVDPSRNFPWDRLARNGFGRWCEAPPALPPASFDALLGLRALGYDVSAPAAAVQAFRRHFTGIDADGALSAAEQALVHCLLETSGRAAGVGSGG